MSNIPDEVKKIKNTKGILITVTGYIYNPGSLKLKKELSEDELRDFQLYMADQLCETFRSAIDTQRYKGRKWPPLSVAYSTWKGKKHLSLNIWEATGTLKKEIKVFKKGNFIAVGFKQKDHYKSKVKINDVGRYMEYGTNGKHGMPPRPLFRPVTIYMRKHVNDYYKKYKKELDKKNKKFLYLDM